jgi:serine/threonine protein phosphatase 1
MIGRFFSRQTRAEAPATTLPDDLRVYAIGDIHGCLTQLRLLRQLITDHAADRPVARNVIVYLGDYVDRGPDSRGVIDFLLSGSPDPFEQVFIKGNHEEGMLDFLKDPSTGSHWLSYGGDATLSSYGVRPPALQDETGLERARAELAARLPPAHLAFLSGLILRHVEGGYVFVHAGLRPGVPLEEQNAEDMIWIRDEFLRSSVDFGHVVVHGHSITETPTVKRNRIGIDTGAFASGRLTCVVLEGSDHTFLTT